MNVGEDGREIFVSHLPIVEPGHRRQKGARHTPVTAVSDRISENIERPDAGSRVLVRCEVGCKTHSPGPRERGVCRSASPSPRGALHLSRLLNGNSLRMSGQGASHVGADRAVRKDGPRRVAVVATADGDEIFTAGKLRRLVELGCSFVLPRCGNCCEHHDDARDDDCVSSDTVCGVHDLLQIVMPTIWTAPLTRRLRTRLLEGVHEFVTVGTSGDARSGGCLAVRRKGMLNVEWGHRAGPHSTFTIQNFNIQHSLLMSETATATATVPNPQRLKPTRSSSVSGTVRSSRSRERRTGLRAAAARSCDTPSWIGASLPFSHGRS